MFTNIYRSLGIKSRTDFQEHLQEVHTNHSVVKTSCCTVLDFTLIDESVASLDHFFEQNAKWNLIIRIVLSQSIGRTEGSNNNKELFDIEACSKSKVYVKIKYTTRELKVLIDS